MNIDLIIEILSEAFYNVIIILLPILGAGLIIGVIISVFQAATSIQEQTLTFVPKIIITALVIIFTLPFAADKLISFTHKIFNLIITVTK
ncbi:MAG: flagellar biosynthetic protein FliQ [Ignavibacteriae bacterium]|nr:MAG: flagellar biosynthetic protein FliQ [Ignavibacteriota bacterium]